MKYRFANVIRCSVALLLTLACAAQSSQPSGGMASPKNAEIVNVFFTVGDSQGALVPSLSKDSFQVREDGRPQAIKYFSAQSEMPLTLGVLVDTSGAMQGALPAERAAAADLLRQVVKEKDLAFVISFDVTVDLLQDLTSDLSLLRAGLERAKVNVGLRSRRSAGLLHDAVYLAADEILRKQVGRKALVILTSGVDQGSRTKLKDAIQAAQKADAVCYVVLFSRSIFGTTVADLADQTGGRVFTVRTGEKLAETLSQIAGELHNQYSLGYTPDNDKHDGGFRAIEITSKEGYKIRVRKGYYAPDPAR